MEASSQILIPVRDYDLDATLSSGQAFRWRRREKGWDGVIGQRWVRLERVELGIQATASPAVDGDDWDWLTFYLQSDINLEAILETFPQDQPLGESVMACRGLRLLRQDPWECLASFICSSTKQIVQIQQIIEQLCQRHGPPLMGQKEHAHAFGFPSAETLANLSEAELRACKMGFRAPYVRESAQAIATGQLDLEHLRGLTYPKARAALTELPGVGEKIANCVLLFAYDFPQAFPVDVWIMRALRELYFPKRRPSPRRLRKFVETYFGPHSGYAQQYLFHYIRMHRPEE